MFLKLCPLLASIAIFATLSHGLTVSRRGLNLIKEFEGLRLRAYKQVIHIYYTSDIREYMKLIYIYPYKR